jgi:hypothetical protein
MRSITRWDVAVSIFLFLIAAYNGGTQTMLLCVIAFFLWLRVRPAPKVVALPPSASTATKALAFLSAPESEAEEEDNGFEIESNPEGGTSIELGVDIDYRPCPNHFRLDYRYDTASSKSEYEYRVEGVKVFVRLINDIDNSVGTARGGDWQVRDGVVLEQDLRDRFNAQSDFIKRAFPEIDKKIADLRTLTEWREMKPPGLQRCLRLHTFQDCAGSGYPTLIPGRAGAHQGCSRVGVEGTRQDRHRAFARK